MKKIISLILCIIFVFSFVACKEEKESNETVKRYHIEIDRYVEAGRLDNFDLKVGDPIDVAMQKLQATLDDHGDSNYSEYEIGDYTIMTDGVITCFYKTEDAASGITHIVAVEEAFGFKNLESIKTVRDALKSLGYTASEREPILGELFFMPVSEREGATILSYNIGENHLTFVFKENELSHIMIYN